MTRVFVALVVAAVTLSAIAWMIANPLDSYWDEAGYHAAVIHHQRAVRHNGFSGFLTGYYLDPFRPPANIVLALPFGPSLLPLRLLSFAGFLAAALLLAATVRAIAGAAAGALALTMTIVSPVLVLSLKMFGTEYPLLLAVAGTLYFAFASQHRARWIGLGIAIGLGLLSKTSFIIVLIPILISLLTQWSAGALAGASTLGASIAATWWLRNGLTAIRFVLASRQSTAHSLGSPWQFTTLLRWLAALVQYGTGYGIAIVIIAIAIFAPWRKNRFAIATFAAGAMLLAAAYSGANHNPRWLAPGLFLLFAAAATMAAPLLERSRALIPIAAIIFAQMIALTLLHRTTIAPSYVWRGTTEVMAPIEQWDFTPVKRLVASDQPRIALMGTGYQLNPANIEQAWLQSGTDALARMVWKENYDLREAVRFAGTAQVVITAPGFVGDPRDGQPRVNIHNAEFAQAVAASGLFAGPYTVEVGVNEPATVVVFLHR
jgi:hypothetical protein